MNDDAIFHAIQSISSKLKIENNTKFENEPYILKSYLSTVEIYDSEVFNLKTEGTLIQVTSTTLILNSVNFYKIRTYSSGVLIQSILDGYLDFSNIVYRDSSLRFLINVSSNTSLTDSQIYNINTYNYELMNFIFLEDSSIKNTTFTNISSSHTDMIYIDRSTFDFISDCKFSSINSTVISVTNSDGLTVTNDTFYNVSQAIYASNSQITGITSSNFTQ